MIVYPGVGSEIFHEELYSLFLVSEGC